MKKIFILLIACLVLLSGCSAKEIIEIEEKLFITQINEIYTNHQDYLGKIVKYEGIFVEYEVPGAAEISQAVIRYGPGCCGDDDSAGFEVTWKNKNGQYPENNDWVEAVGVLEEFEFEGGMFLRVVLDSLEVLPVRGAETVEQ